MKSLFAFAMCTSLILLAGCSSPESKAQVRADEICNCVKSIGINKNLNVFKLQDRGYMSDLERKVERELPQKLLVILKEIDEELSDLSKNEKKEYTRALLKSLLDTDCADILLDNTPYQMLGPGIEVLEEDLDRRERY